MMPKGCKDPAVSKSIPDHKIPCFEPAPGTMAQIMQAILDPKALSQGTQLETFAWHDFFNRDGMG